MTIDNNNPKHIIADDGKVFRRKSDGFIYGSEIYLGKTWYIGGVRLSTPRDETPSDFEEIDVPNDEETTNE